MAYIYKTTNNLTGIIYIGQTERLSSESMGYLGSGSKLKQAIKKFGRKNFTKEILEDDIDTILLNEREIYWIEFYNSIDPNIGYNVTRGGSFLDKSALLKSVFSRDDMKEMIKKKNLALWENEEYRKRVTDANLKTWSTSEKRNEHSDRMKEAYKNPLAKQNLIDSYKRMDVLECPHCGKKCKRNHAMNSHFENCVKHSDAEKREAALKRRNEINSRMPKLQCPRCNSIGGVANMRRWHFDNCKRKL